MGPSLGCFVGAGREYGQKQLRRGGSLGRYGGIVMGIALLVACTPGIQQVGSGSETQKSISSTDNDGDGVIDEDDCDDNDASVGTKATDIDCDGVFTVADCDDEDSTKGSQSADGDCDGVLGTVDCNDNDAANTWATTTDGDCDGVLGSEDCDDANENNTGRVEGGCSTCEIGSYATADACFLCAAGTYSDLVGSTQCGECPPGFHAPLDGASTCDLCDSGSFSSAATCSNHSTFSALRPISWRAKGTQRPKQSDKGNAQNRLEGKSCISSHPCLKQ